MRPLRGLALVAVLLVNFTSIALPAVARADEDEVRAKELYRNGERLYEEGLYEDAILAWERAYDLSKRPLLLYNMANALERIGRWEEALQRINQYRALAPEAERETLNRRMQAIERRLEKKRRSDADEARLAEVARAASERSAQANSGRSIGINSVALQAQPRGRRGPPAGTLALLGLGGAGLASSAVFSGLALQARNEAALLCQGIGETVFCPETAADSLSRDAQFSLGADIGLIAGGATLGTAIILSILDSQGLLPGSPPRVVLLPSASTNQASLNLQGTF